MATEKPLIERLRKRDLELLRTRKATNAQMAEKYGVSEPYMSRVVASVQEKEPGKTTAQREAAAKLYKVRIEFRDKLAKQVMAGKRTMANACEQAGCSERTIFRHIEKFRAEKARKGPAKKRA